MKKKTYNAPTLRTIDISATEILAGSITVGDIGGNGPRGNDNYDIIPGYDRDQGGWGTGTPD